MLKPKKNLSLSSLLGYSYYVTAELIGGKLIQIGPFVMSIGILPWPIVFLTDLINEYFGKRVKLIPNYSWINRLFFPYFTFGPEHSSC
jgi:uncharacterized PurR-regulated membrane protein YhhQ (DUF165 family)